MNNAVTTAKLCAFARAWYSRLKLEHRDKIFDDYLAYDFLGEAEYNALLKENSNEFIGEYLAPIPLFRAKFTETRLRKFALERGLCQYVICGAGYDTFSFRNANENITVFEIDRKNAQLIKKKRIEKLGLAIPTNVNFIEADFEKDDLSKTLKEAGFNPKIETFFSILGVAYYLPLPAFAKTISHISALAPPNSMLVFDYPNETLRADYKNARLRKLSHLAEGLGEVMQGGYYFDDMREAVCSEGFRIESYLSAFDAQEFYFNGENCDLKAFDGVYIVSALKKAEANYII